MSKYFSVQCAQCQGQVRVAQAGDDKASGHHVDASRDDGRDDDCGDDEG